MKLVTNRQHLVGQEVAHSVKSSSRKLLVRNEGKNVDVVQKFRRTLARKKLFLLYAKSALFRERGKVTCTRSHRTEVGDTGGNFDLLVDLSLGKIIISFEVFTR